MIDNKREHPAIKTKLHPRNKHRERYDFKLLCAAYPELTAFVAINKYGDESIDFFNPDAVKALNKALLKQYYDISHWDIPKGYLCPPIPGRADYIHYLADVLAAANKDNLPAGSNIRVLDIGTGANCIYPIIGTKEYGWSFVGSEVDATAVSAAKALIENNPALHGKLDLRLQKNPQHIFKGIIQQGERFDLTLCNPPFHSSAEEAHASTLRKLSNLKQKKVTTPVLNFGGQNKELWCEGGEVAFISKMIQESTEFADSCLWFTSLVSKESSLKPLYAELRKAGALLVKTLSMGQGNKNSRALAWTFLSKEKQINWSKTRWQ
ncbi:MAG TPA: 23S rRNA (adenine(1618)-N(6))-methyltransferase RlmF [Bacteroidia bacterium]|nr:23S rRNA (adenine(1618)-N(6))-methyltransferase RlmF [Bacteroidia bacterium]